MVDSYYLRRDKSLLGTLPAKHEFVVWLKLAPNQVKAYMTYLRMRGQSMMSRLHNDSKKKDKFKCTFKCMQELQKISSHVELCTPKPPEDKNGVQNSVKFRFLRDLIPYLRPDDGSMLIFSPSLQLLNLFEIELVRMNYKYCKIDGQTEPADRKTFVEAFQNGDFPILLLSKVGSLGYTLTRATSVILLEPSWNPRLQRAHCRLKYYKNMIHCHFLTQRITQLYLKPILKDLSIVKRRRLLMIY